MDDQLLGTVLAGTGLMLLLFSGDFTALWLGGLASPQISFVAGGLLLLVGTMYHSGNAPDAVSLEG